MSARTPLAGLLRYLLWFVILAVCYGGDAMSSLFPNPVVELGSPVGTVTVADFNNDGHEDLLAETPVDHLDPRFAAGFAVLLGDGHGEFTETFRYRHFGGVLEVRVADFNEDDLADVAALLSDGDQQVVQLFLNVGQGEFTLGESLVVDDFVRAMVVGDFNKDGHVDLGVFVPFLGELRVLFGSGNGKFPDEAQSVISGKGLPLVAGDFDGDGDDDLAVAQGYDPVLVFFSNGDGSFRPGPSIEVTFLVTLMEVFDLDQNGRDDLVLGGGVGLIDSRVTLHRSLDPEGFERVGIIRVGGEEPVDIHLSDLNGDGVLDAAIAVLVRGSARKTVVALGSGEGRFELSSPVQGGVSVDGGDFNEDGTPDLVTAQLSFNALWVLPGNGDGTFGKAPMPVGDNPRTLLQSDFNGDGKVDLLALNRDSSDLSLMVGHGDGTFEAEERIALRSYPEEMVSGDFNNDGIPDLVVRHRVADVFTVLLGNGDGTFTQVSDPTLPYPGTVQAMAVGEFDGDGIQDLVITVGVLGFFGQHWLFFGQGDGTFVIQTLLGGPFPSGSSDHTFGLVARDFNGDGLDDLAVTWCQRETFCFEYDSAGLTIYLLDVVSVPVSPPVELRVFEPAQEFDIGERSSATASIEPADLNSDGHEDLVVTGGKDLSIFLGDGMGRFSRTTRIDYFFADAATVGDFNADGVQDLAFPGPRVTLGNGDGTVGPVLRFLGRGGRDIVAGDFNADGREDLAEFSGFFSECNPGPPGVLCFDTGLAVHLNQHPFPNQPPVAMASADAAVECTSPAGAQAVLDGSASSDPDSSPGTNDDIVVFEWFGSGLDPLRNPALVSLLGVGEILSVTLPLGTHSVTLRVVDSQGEVDTDTISINVVDTTPPDISAILAPSLLWPPNHRMVDIEALVSASDLCSTPALLLNSVASNEPDDAEGTGDGKTLNDVQGAEIGRADFQFQLRAERAGTGEGRTYVVTYLATDASGNTSTATAFALVPHDVGGVTEPLMISTLESGEGTVNLWTEVPEALYYNVMRGEVSNLREFENSFHLGQLACIASATAQTSTLGSEDRELPPLGEAFFYLVEYNDGLPSGYGTESAAKERFAPPGQSSCP